MTGRCNQCGQELVEIDNHGERLIGCLTCNLWSAEGKERWVRLGEEDLRGKPIYVPVFYIVSLSEVEKA